MRFRAFDLATVTFSILFALIGSIISVVRYWQYDANYFDFGIFDQAIWKVAHFQAPIIDHFIVGGKIIFADHFSPSIFLFSPLYWFSDQSEIILIAQAVVAALSGFVIYKISQEVIKHNLWSLTIMLCYFLFVGLQNAVITDFHELTAMTLSMALCWWAAIKRKTILYFLMLIITLGFKESLFLLGIAASVALFFLQKDWRRIAIITMIISIIWGTLTIKYVIPYFSYMTYIYSYHLPNNIQTIISNFFNEPEKQRTLFFSFASFGFLPIFSPQFWLAMIQDYGQRFLPEGFNTRWGLALHYNAQSAVILALSSIYALKLFLKHKIFKKYSLIICIFLLLSSFFLNTFILHGPFHLIYNPAFYSHTKDIAFLDTLVSKVPKNASVMTHNNIAGHFTHQRIYLLRETYEKYAPEYIILDVRDGQGPTNFFGGKGDPKDILKALKADTKYQIIYQTKEQYIFKRK